MSRYIDADEAKENVCKWECGGEPDCPLNKHDAYTHEECNSMRAIDECRTIDAVPVVRCKDCIHRRKGGFSRSETDGWTVVFTAPCDLGDEGFCSKGEKVTES